jgi:hypothetical protein
LPLFFLSVEFKILKNKTHNVLEFHRGYIGEASIFIFYSNIKVFCYLKKILK